MGTEISAAHRLKTLSGLILLCQLVISHAGNQAQPTYRASIEILNPPAFVSQGHVLLVLYNCESHQVVHLDVLVSSLTKTEVGVFHKRWTCSPGDMQVKEVKLDFPDQMVYREDYFLRHSVYISDVLLRAWMSEYPGDINIPEKSTYKSASVKTFHFIQALPPYSRPYKVRQETLSWDQNLIWKLRKDRIPQCGAEEEVVHFLDFPYACTGEIFGVLRVLEPYKDGVLERRRQHFIGSPRCSFLVWVFLVRPCATRFCGVLYHLNEGHQYITPTILLEDTGHLHVQVELLSRESQAFRSFSSLPLLKWCQIQLTFDLSQSTLRIQCGEKSSNMTYRFTQNALLSDTVGSFIFGGSQYVPGINGFFGPIVYYRNKVLPTNHQTPLPKLLANLEFSDWFHKCEAFKEECLEKYEQFLLQSSTKDNTDSCSDVYHELVTRYKEVSASLECTEWESPPPPHRAAVTRLLRRAGLRGVLGAQGKFAYKLMNDLFANYSNALRPVEDMDKVMNVTLQVTLSQIIDMDERNQILMAYLWIRQVWFDAYLRWNKDDYDGLDTIRIPRSYVWRPDIVLYNNADDQFTGSMETNVVIRYDGQIMWDSPAITKSSCKVDVSFFPFDGQQCRLTFGSWTYNGNQIDILNHLDTADLTDFVENVEWEILGMPAKKNVITYGCCSEPYPDVTYTLMLKRRASFYIFNLLLPCVMISFLAPLGFYLPADSGEKVSLGVTVLLALTVFQLLVAESMPPSENVPLIGKYYIATMTMITASTALTIFIMNIHHCGPEAKPVPKWAKKFILQYMSRVFFVYEVGESCKRPKPDPEPEKLPKVQVMNGQAKREEPTAIFKNCPENDGLKVKEMTDEQDLGHGNASNIGDSTWKDSGQYVNSEHCRYSDCPKTHCLCHNERLLKNVEYMANCFREQKAAQIRTGEWKKVAKVMDRFFMWVFFIMVFFMSVLIMGKAI